jgi:hypothetical protein
MGTKTKRLRQSGGVILYELEDSTFLKIVKGKIGEIGYGGSWGEQSPSDLEHSAEANRAPSCESRLVLG